MIQTLTSVCAIASTILWFGTGCREAPAPTGVTEMAATEMAPETPVDTPLTPEPVAPAPTTQTQTQAPTPPSTRPAPTDPLAEANRTYAMILAQVVTTTGLVRYDRLPSHDEALASVVQTYARTQLPTDRMARLAFWCNAYNANVLAKVLAARRATGFETVVKVPGFFDKDQIVVAGASMPLNDLENKQIRPMGDPRIHAALVCAAMSCPPLRAEPFDALRLDAQLDEQCRRWINDPAKFRIVGGKLGLSQILEWYGDDFVPAPHHGPVGFVKAYADPDGALRRYIGSRREVETAWLAYDWTLNQGALNRMPMDVPDPDRCDPKWEIAPRVVKQMLEAGESVLLVDCRPSPEREIARIDGDVSIPLEDVAVNLDRLDAHEDGPIVIYCHTGRRSLMLTTILREQGLVDVRSMAGGIQRWSEQVDSEVPMY